MNMSLTAATGCAFAVATLGSVILGQAGVGHASPSAESTAAADYTNLLISEGTMASAAGGSYVMSTPTQNPGGRTGVSARFSDAAGGYIDDTVWVLPDSSQALEQVRLPLDSVVGGSPQPVSVGHFGTMISGMSVTTGHAETVLVFAEGRAVIEIDFQSPGAEPVAMAAALAVGREQDTAIRSRLTS
jgi:hypothetical protein